MRSPGLLTDVTADWLSDGMTDMSTTVVMPVRNGEFFIAAALESVFAQTARPSEVLVIDGASTDASVRIASSFPGVRVIAQPGTGLYDALNLGVRAARGDCIAFLESDDRWLPNKLERQLACLSTHPEYAGVVGAVQFHVEPGATLPPGFRHELLDSQRVARIPGTLLARRAMFDAAGPFDDTLDIAADVDWFARCKDRGLMIGSEPDLVLLKRMHGTNLSLDARRNTAELLQAMRGSIRRQRQNGSGGDA